MSSARSEDRGGTARAALIAAGLVLLAFSGPLLAGERFYFRDLSQNHGPLIEGARRLIARGEPLEWNPWLGGGEPLAANPNLLLFHPSGLLSLALPAPYGLVLATLFGSLLAVLSLTLLLRDLGRSPAASAMGAVIYALSGYALSLATLPNLLAASAWVFPALYLIRLAHRRALWIPAAVIATAFVLVPCDPAAAAVLGVFAFVLSVRPADGSSGRRTTGDPADTSDGDGTGGADRTGGRSGAGRGQDGKEGTAPQTRHGWGATGTLRRLGLTGVILAAGVLASAYETLPAWLWIRVSARSWGLAAADALKWSLTARRLPELIAPGFLGDPASFASWWSAGLFETGLPLLLSIHVGLPALMLALLGATWGVVAPRGEDRTERLTILLVSAAGLLFLYEAMGPSISSLSTLLPATSFFRYPEKLVLGTILGLSILAARGLDLLLETDAPARGGSRIVPSRAGASLSAAAGAVGVVLLLTAGFVTEGVCSGWFRLPSALSGMVASANQGARISLLIAAAFAALLATTLLLLPRLGSRGRRLALVGLVGLSLASGAVTPSKRMPPWRLRADPSAPPAALAGGVFFEEKIAGAMRPGVRLFRFERPPGFAYRTRTGTLADGFAWDRRSLARSSAAEFDVPLAFDRSTDLLDPRGTSEAAAFFASQATEIQTRFWSLDSVGLVIAYTPLEAPGLVLEDRIEGESNVPVLLYRNLDALPLARIVARSRRVATDHEAHLAIAAAAPDDWMNEVRLGGPLATASPSRVRSAGSPPAEEVGPTPGARRVVEHATIVERHPGRLKIAVRSVTNEPRTAPGARWLVVAENAVPGWRGAVDGREAPLLRAEGMILAVELDGAQHEVDLWYEPPGRKEGIALSSGVVLAALLAPLGSLLWRRRKGAQEARRSPGSTPRSREEAPAPSRSGGGASA